MAYKITTKISTWGLAAIMLLTATAPMLLLYAKAFYKFFFTKTLEVPAINMGLFFKSIVISLICTLFCVVLGMLVSIFLWSLTPKKSASLFGFIIICALIPHFIHVHSWIKTVDFINFVIEKWTFFTPNFTGVGAVILTTVMSYLPFTIVLGYMGLESVPKQILDLSATESDPIKTFGLAIMPYTWGYILTAGIFVFLLTVNDFAIPSVFGVSVYALELFALFSAGKSLYAITLAAIPMIALSILILLSFGVISKRKDLTENFYKGQNPFRKERFMKIIRLVGGLVLTIYAGVPIISMIMESFKVNDLFKVLNDSADQISFSFLTSILTAVVGVIPAALYSFLRSEIRGKRVITFLLALPFLVPSAILGLSLISFWNSSFLSNIYQSPVMTAIGLSVRFGILAILYMSYRFDRIEKDMLDSLRLDVKPIMGFFKVILPLIIKDIIACMLLIFALAMGEYGISILITPPGYQMITVKIYNYIHYGASEIVFSLNLTIFISVLIAGAIFLKIRTLGEGFDRNGK